MISKIKLVASVVVIIGLAGCVEDTGGKQRGDRHLKGNKNQFASMHDPCLHKAARLTGIPKKQIVVTDRLKTGGGPILTLSARGTPYTCRLNANGSVTVFSEFAN
jgi:hypothetical protein